MEIKASDAGEAWGLAGRLFPAGYEKDEDKSRETGAAVYRSLECGVDDYISDFGDRLVVSHQDGSSETIWISPCIENENLGGCGQQGLSYRVFITSSYEAACLIARGLASSKEFSCKANARINHGSAECSDAKGVIPGAVETEGRYYAALSYCSGGSAKYELTVC